MQEQTHFESLVEALQQAIAFENGDTSMGRIRYVKVPDIEPVQEFSKEKIKELRQKVNLPQKYFAELVGVTPRTVEAWEVGTRKPTGTAKRLFQLMDNDPTILNSMMR